MYNIHIERRTKMVKDVFRKPTINEINYIVERANLKKNEKNLKMTELSTLLDVNYCNLLRVMNGQLVNYQIINKLNVWINE